MAYTRLPVHIPLDEVAQILQLNPAHFNQGVVEGTSYAPCSADCVDVWCNESWQSLQGLSRASLAQQIVQAEIEVSGFIGESIYPKEEKRLLEIRRPSGDASVFSSAQLYIGPHLVDYAPYVPVKIGTASGASIVGTDEDLDGFDEDITLTVGSTIPIGEDEIVYYIGGRFGEPQYWIRPHKTFSITENGPSDYTIKASFWPWQLVDPVVLNAPSSKACSCLAFDFRDMNLRVGAIDVGYMKRDTSKPMARLFYGEADASCGSPLCPPCEEGVVYGVYKSIGDRIIVQPAVFNEDTGAWEEVPPEDCGCGRWPYAIEVTYYTSYCTPTPRSELCQDIKEAVALLAGARIQVNNCDCECGAGQWFRSLQVDLAEVRGAGRYFTSEKLNNPFGNRRGEQMAYDRLRALSGGSRLIVRHGNY